jgi:hypothetical protein
MSQPESEHFPIRLRPLPATLVGNFVGAVIIAACGIAGVWGGFAVGLVTHQGWVFVLLGAPFAIYGLAMTAVASRIELTLDRDHATIRGYFRTVTIPRAAVRTISNYPSILWVDSLGRSRTSPVNALNLYRSGRVQPNSRALARTNEKVAMLRQWVSAQK